MPKTESISTNVHLVDKMSVQLYDAVARGDLLMVKRLLESTDVLKDTDNQYRRLLDMTIRTSYVTTLASIKGHPKCLAYLCSVGCPITDHTVLMSIQSVKTSINCLEYCQNSVISNR
jgi:hypothetical protein